MFLVRYGKLFVGAQFNEQDASKMEKKKKKQCRPLSVLYFSYRHTIIYLFFLSVWNDFGPYRKVEIDVHVVENIKGLQLMCIVRGGSQLLKRYKPCQCCALVLSNSIHTSDTVTRHIVLALMVRVTANMT